MIIMIKINICGGKKSIIDSKMSALEAEHPQWNWKCGTDKIKKQT